MIYQGGLTMHWFRRSNDTSSINLSNRLVSQANAKQRNVWPKNLNNLTGHTCFVRSAGPWRNHDMIRLDSFNFVQSDLIITSHDNLRSEFSQILIQVIGKA